MKPIAILRHFISEGPGYFATFLDQRSIPWQLIEIDRGECVPAGAGQFSGVCLMGGPMSVNDPLPWIADACALIRNAAVLDIPIIGHCLGGQLMSKAFGGSVTKSPLPEIGWATVRAETNDCARLWLGGELDETGGVATVFQWHSETFSLPNSCELIMHGEACRNQMFASGPHLAMQCHVEMTMEMIGEWCRSWPAERLGLSTVQTPGEMRALAASRLPGLRQLADRLYTVWIKGLKTA